MPYEQDHLLPRLFAYIHRVLADCNMCTSQADCSSSALGFLTCGIVVAKAALV